MKELIKDLLYYEGTENEEFGLIRTDLPYKLKSPKEVDQLFNDSNYIPGQLNRGQRKISIRLGSIEDLMIVAAYFIGKGWYNRMKLPELKEQKSLRKERQIWVINKIMSLYKQKDWSWLKLDYRLEIIFLVDRKDLTIFIQTLSNIPNYKIIWANYPKNRYEFRKRINLYHIIE